MMLMDLAVIVNMKYLRFIIGCLLYAYTHRKDVQSATGAHRKTTDEQERAASQQNPPAKHKALPHCQKSIISYASPSEVGNILVIPTCLGRMSETFLEKNLSSWSVHVV